MTTLSTAADMSIVLSGGSSNLDPTKSLGGDPSSSPVAPNVLNNLFDDVSKDETAFGHEDYRCVYLFNDGPSPLYNLRLYVEQDFGVGTSVELGVERQNEVQTITIGPAHGGELLLTYGQHTFSLPHNPSSAALASSLRSALLSVGPPGDPLFRDVGVVGRDAPGGGSVLTASWSGRDGGRNLSPITLAQGGNLLEPIGGPHVS